MVGPTITPPVEFSQSVLTTAQSVIRGQASALSYLSELYDRDDTARDQFVMTLQILYNTVLGNGKVVFSAMGKSFKIAEKIAATMNSLNIHSVSLHPQDALHGDLGIIRPATDVLVMITSSGSTPELVKLLDHTPSGLCTVCLTCTPDSVLAKRSHSILTAEVPPALSEAKLYGLAAPTVTTTACLVVGDALAITLSEMLETDLGKRKESFGRMHPGGAIGAAWAKEQRQAMTVEPIGILPGGFAACKNQFLDLLRVCAGNKYVLVQNSVLVQTADIVAAEQSSGGEWVACLTKLSAIANTRGIPLSNLPAVSTAELESGQVGQLCLVKDSGVIKGVYEGPKAI